jgi:SAM-dependent methyltransferase
MSPGERLFAAAAERNREPILRVLERVLPARGAVLEVASGTGQHAAHFAAALPGLVWQPTELDAGALESIAAWTAALGNVRAPIRLDVTEAPWPIETVDAIYGANMIHIAPWSVALALLAGAARHLRRGGLLVLYGPFKVGGRHTAPTNAAFDESLRARDPSFGVRDLEAVAAAAREHGLDLEERVAMPAENQILVMRAQGKETR